MGILAWISRPIQCGFGRRRRRRRHGGHPTPTTTINDNDNNRNSNKKKTNRKTMATMTMRQYRQPPPPQHQQHHHRDQPRQNRLQSSSLPCHDQNNNNNKKNADKNLTKRSRVTWHPNLVDTDHTSHTSASPGVLLATRDIVCHGVDTATDGDKIPMETPSSSFISSSSSSSSLSALSTAIAATTTATTAAMMEDHTTANTIKNIPPRTNPLPTMTERETTPRPPPARHEYSCSEIASSSPTHHPSPDTTKRSVHFNSDDSDSSVNIVGELFRAAHFFDGYERSDLWYTRSDYIQFKQQERNLHGFLRFHPNNNGNDDVDSVSRKEETEWNDYIGGYCNSSSSSSTNHNNIVDHHTDRNITKYHIDYPTTVGATHQQQESRQPTQRVVSDDERDDDPHDMIDDTGVHDLYPPSARLTISMSAACDDDSNEKGEEDAFHRCNRDYGCGTPSSYQSDLVTPRAPLMTDSSNHPIKLPATTTVATIPRAPLMVMPVVDRVVAQGASKVRKPSAQPGVPQTSALQKAIENFTLLQELVLHQLTMNPGRIGTVIPIIQEGLEIAVPWTWSQPAAMRNTGSRYHNTPQASLLGISPRQSRSSPNTTRGPPLCKVLSPTLADDNVSDISWCTGHSSAPYRSVTPLTALPPRPTRQQYLKQPSDGGSVTGSCGSSHRSRGSNQSPSSDHSSSSTTTSRSRLTGRHSSLSRESDDISDITFSSQTWPRSSSARSLGRNQVTDIGTTSMSTTPTILSLAEFYQQRILDPPRGMRQSSRPTGMRIKRPSFRQRPMPLHYPYPFIPPTGDCPDHCNITLDYPKDYPELSTDPPLRGNTTLLEPTATSATADIAPSHSSTQGQNRVCGPHRVRWIQGDIDRIVSAPDALVHAIHTTKEYLWWPKHVLHARRLSDIRAIQQNDVARLYDRDCQQVYQYLFQQVAVHVTQQTFLQSPNTNVTRNCLAMKQFQPQHLRSLLSPSICRGLAAGCRGMELGGLMGRCRRSMHVVQSVLEWYYKAMTPFPLTVPRPLAAQSSLVTAIGSHFHTDRNNDDDDEEEGVDSYPYDFFHDNFSTSSLPWSERGSKNLIGPYNNRFTKYNGGTNHDAIHFLAQTSFQLSLVDRIWSQVLAMGDEMVYRS